MRHTVKNVTRALSGADITIRSVNHHRVFYRFEDHTGRMCFGYQTVADTPPQTAGLIAKQVASIRKQLKEMHP